MAWLRDSLHREPKNSGRACEDPEKSHLYNWVDFDMIREHARGSIPITIEIVC